MRIFDPHIHMTSRTTTDYEQMYASGVRALVEPAFGLALERVVVDHLNEVTVRMVAESGCWMAFSIYPDTKMDPDRMVRILREFGTERVLVNSAADWGKSDPLRTLRTGEAMLAAG